MNEPRFLNGYFRENMYLCLVMELVERTLAQQSSTSIVNLLVTWVVLLVH